MFDISSLGGITLYHFTWRRQLFIRLTEIKANLFEIYRVNDAVIK